MEFLDIDHNTWSLIIFFSQIFLTLCMAMFLIFGNFKSLIILFISWIFSQITFLSYGMFKDLSGFILLFAFNVLITSLIVIINVEKVDEEIEEDE